MAQKPNRCTATLDMCQKVGVAVPHSGRGAGELGPHLTHCGLGRGLPLYCTKWHLDLYSRLVITDMGRKWGPAVPFSEGGKRGDWVSI